MQDETTSPEVITSSEPDAPRKAPPVRGPNPENAARLDHIMKRTEESPGIDSPTLARELGISTLTCSQLTDRLVRSGRIVIHKLPNNVRTNYTPDAYQRMIEETALAAKAAAAAAAEVAAE